MSFDPQNLSDDDARAIVASLTKGFTASVALSLTDRPFTIQRQVIALDNATLETAPFVLSTPFTSIIIEDATDTTTFIYLKPHTQDSYQGYKKLSLNDSLTISAGVAKSYIHWPAQPGKTITLLVGVGVEFRSGKNISQNAGGVSVNEGSSCSSDAAGSVGVAAAILLAALSTRNTALIQNQGSAPIYVGGAAVTVKGGANPGIEVQPGGCFKWSNTSALYAISTAASQAVAILSEA